MQRDLYGSLLVIGVMSHIAIQVILNIAVVTNSLPNTGVILPFISYGGTSIIFLDGGNRACFVCVKRHRA